MKPLQIVALSKCLLQTARRDKPMLQIKCSYSVLFSQFHQRGGHVAKIARAELEKQLGRSVVTSANAKGLKAPDDVKQIEDGNNDEQ